MTMAWRVKRLSAAVPIALLLVLALSGSALATSWAAKVSLTTSGEADAGSHSLVTLDSSNAVAIFQNGPNVWVRRTADSGATWKPRLRLSNNMTEPWFSAISGRATDVDAVWSEVYPTAHTSILEYRQSTDSGATFAPAVPLASGNEAHLTAPDVAHGPNGVVAVAWHDSGANTIRVRVSTNSGISFAPAQTLATISSSYFRPPSVAVGNGVIYVAYFSDATHVKLRRSIDNGATWKPARAIASDGSMADNIYALSVAASGSHAYVAYTAVNSTQTWIRYRRTTTKGSSWSALKNLSTPGANESEVPTLSLANSVLRAAYDQCSNASCTHSAIKYQSSSNGTTWSAAQTASHAGPQWATPAGIGTAGKIIVLYTADNGGNNPNIPNSDLYARAGTP
jgi:hypothetical protein